MMRTHYTQPYSSFILLCQFNCKWLFRMLKLLWFVYQWHWSHAAFVTKASCALFVIVRVQNRILQPEEAEREGA